MVTVLCEMTDISPRRLHKDDEFLSQVGPSGSGYNAARYQPKGTISLTTQEPESIIGEKVKIRGDLSFERLLKIDGNFEGKLITTSGSLVVSSTGKLIGNVENIQDMVVEGNVVGNIAVNSLVLKGHAFVFGDVLCRSLSIEAECSIVGNIRIIADDYSTADDLGS